MVKNLDDLQQISKDNVDATLKSFGAVSKGVQAIATEAADYSKKSFAEGTQAFEKLFSAKSIDKVMEVQQTYMKSAYESFVAETSKFGELYTALAKESYKPYESYFGKVAAK